MHSPSKSIKCKVVSIAAVETAKNLQLENLYCSLLETDEQVTVEASNRRLLINCIKTCMKFKQFQSCSKIPEILFCFDGQSNFLCPFFELSSFQYDISLPKEVVNRYSGKGLSFDDKKKILYHIFAGERLHEVPEIPWWALTLPQMVAFTQEKVENIYDEKVRALSYPHTWLATKLKSGCEFRKQFGSPPNFDYTVFGFSLKTPLDCSWSCIKTKENKQFNAQMKNYFAPLHQNILCQKPVTVNKKPSQKPRVSPPLANNPPVSMEMKKKKISWRSTFKSCIVTEGTTGALKERQRRDQLPARLWNYPVYNSSSTTWTWWNWPDKLGNSHMCWQLNNNDSQKVQQFEQEPEVRAVCGY